MIKNVLFCEFGKLGTECLNRLIQENYNVVYILHIEKNQIKV